MTIYLKKKNEHLFIIYYILIFTLKLYIKNYPVEKLIRYRAHEL